MTTLKVKAIMEPVELCSGGTVKRDPKELRDMPGQLSGKVILITGEASGIIGDGHRTDAYLGDTREVHDVMAAIFIGLT